MENTATTYTTNHLYMVVIIAAIIILSPSYLAAAAYPIEVKIILKENAHYTSPENTYAALFSAMLSENLDWYYETLTEESAEHEIERYKKYGPDLQQKRYNVFKSIKKVLILDKQPYEDGVYLLLKAINKDGSALQSPSVFVQENGQWKSQKKVPPGDPILDYIAYTPPPSTLTPYQLSFFPNQWSLSWYNWIESKIHADKSANQFTKHPTVLCMLTEDNGDIHLADIDLETIRLNSTVSPQPWRQHKSKTSSRQNQLAVVIDPTSTEKGHYRQQFSSWRRNLKKPLNTKGPFLLARFNTYEAMQSLGEINADTQYEVTISGKLRDGRDFEAKSEIMIITHTSPPKRLEKNTPPYHDTLMNFWWN